MFDFLQLDEAKKSQIQISEQGLAIAEEIVKGFRSGPVQPNVWRDTLVNTLVSRLEIAYI